jgi:hypothetical protein
VSLHYYALAILEPLCGRGRENYVASVVALHVDAVFLSPFEKIFLDFGLVLRWTRDTCETVEVLPNGLRL